MSGAKILRSSVKLQHSPPTMKRIQLSTLLFLLTLSFSRLSLAGPVTVDGEKLLAFLDAMHVEEHWIAGAIVDWKTGEPTGQAVKDDGKHTHCSQFAAAACERTGIYLLRPPEHSAVLLANAQYEWLLEQGRKKGWTAVAEGREAQELANQGTVVVAVYKNQDAQKSGHIAMIRPSTKSIAQIKAEGPQVTQAGGTNHNSCSLKEGFSNHRAAYEKGEILFFAHAKPRAGKKP